MGESELRILILAGGGGHTGYARILAEALSDRAKLLFLAPDDEPISVKRLSTFGEVQTATKPRHPTTPLFSFTHRFVKALLQSFRRLPAADVVVSTGSNFCVPPVIVAWLRGMPIVNLESRVKLLKPSGAARFIGRFSELTALQWSEQTRFHPRGVVFGPLLPRRTLEPSDSGYVLITGGTYGYEELFDAAVLTGLKNVVLQTGRIDPEEYSKKRPEWRVFAYTDRFNEMLASAQVVVTPPGGTPIEAAAYGKPVVIAPYPEWTRAADREETILFASKIDAVLLDEMTPKGLEGAIEIAKKRGPPTLKDGTNELTEAILRIAREHHDRTKAAN